eukprot:4290282-Alexandrium_andersonii.AAC.1
MSASLVGSEMCIRDSPPPSTRSLASPRSQSQIAAIERNRNAIWSALPMSCLLYTSDAADDM